jgi:hypothetical protein
LTITQYSSDEDSEATQRTVSVASGTSDKHLNRSSTSAFAEVVRAARLKAEGDATPVVGKTT